MASFGDSLALIFCPGASLKVNTILYFIFHNFMYDELICCGENSVYPDQLEASWSGSSLFSTVCICFHTVFKKVYTCLLFKHIKGYAKFFMHYLFFGTSKTFFWQVQSVSDENLLVSWQVSAFAIFTYLLQECVVEVWHPQMVNPLVPPAPRELTTTTVPTVPIVLTDIQQNMWALLTAMPVDLRLP